MTPRRVLVTGAGGFLASALLPLARRRFPRVFAASRATADLSDPAAVRRLVARTRPELVFHLAGSRSGDAESLWRDNVASTLALGAALPGARLVLAGSCAEDAADSPYGRVKRAASLAALSFVPEGVDVRVGVLYNLCGPGTPESLAPGAWAAQAARLERRGGGVLRHGDLSTSRDLLDVRDAAEALLLLGARSGLSGRYDVCSGRRTRMAEVLRLILHAARAPIRARRDPARLRRGEVKVSRGSAARLRALGWKPRVPLSRSLEDTLAWHRRS